ncbi:MAG: ABC transporter permease, partial [Paracoccaceae bacterium]
VELIRFALYLQFDLTSFLVTLFCFAVFFGAAVFMYDPSKGLWARRKGQGG